MLSLTNNSAYGGARQKLFELARSIVTPVTGWMQRQDTESARSAISKVEGLR